MGTLQSWHYTSEYKARKTFFGKSVDIRRVRQNSGRIWPRSNDPFDIDIDHSSSLDEEDWELLFHTQIWVQNNPLHLIVHNGSQKNFVSEDFVKKLGLVTTPHPQPYNIGWMKDGHESQLPTIESTLFASYSFEGFTLLSIFLCPLWWHLQQVNSCHFLTLLAYLLLNFLPLDLSSFFSLGQTLATKLLNQCLFQ